VFRDAESCGHDYLFYCPNKPWSWEWINIKVIKKSEIKKEAGKEKKERRSKVKVQRKWRGKKEKNDKETRARDKRHLITKQKTANKIR
jgi:hypothetical protein